jgi:hypothetical protein
VFTPIVEPMREVPGITVPASSVNRWDHSIGVPVMTDTVRLVNGFGSTTAMGTPEG